MSGSNQRRIRSRRTRMSPKSSADRSLALSAGDRSGSLTQSAGTLALALGWCGCRHRLESFLFHRPAGAAMFDLDHFGQDAERDHLGAIAAEVEPDRRLDLRDLVWLDAHL